MDPSILPEPRAQINLRRRSALNNWKTLLHVIEIIMDPSILPDTKGTDQPA